MAPTEDRTDSNLALTEKIGYGMGDFAANLVIQTQMMFLLNFYTEVYGLDVAAVGVLLAVSRVVDAVNDLVMGTLADRTRTRWGTFRPWLLFTAVPLGICFFLVFASPPFTETGRFVWATMTLLLLIVVYGANNIPYSALGGILSADPEERVSVAAWRFNLAMFGTFLVQTFTLSLIQDFGQGDERVGYRAAVLLWASVATVGALVAFFSTKERMPPQPRRAFSLRRDVGLLVATRSWLTLAATSLLLYVCLAVRGSVTLFYFQYALAREDLFGRFNGMGMAFAMVGIFCSKLVSTRLGKRNTFQLGMVLSGILATGFYFVNSQQVVLLFALQILFQVVFGATVPVLWGMIADVADLIECRTSERITAFTFAATLFCFKIGLGIGSAAAAWLLDLTGYQPNQPQISDAIVGIRLLFSFLPGVLLAGAAVCLLGYDITLAREKNLAHELQRVRSG